MLIKFYSQPFFYISHIFFHMLFSLPYNSLKFTSLHNKHHSSVSNFVISISYTLLLLFESFYHLLDLRFADLILNIIHGWKRLSLANPINLIFSAVKTVNQNWKVIFKNNSWTQYQLSMNQHVLKPMANKSCFVFIPLAF